LSAASLLEEVIDAHGGAERWQTLNELSIDVSAGGLAVASKFQGRGLSRPRADAPSRVSAARRQPISPSSGPDLDSGARRLNVQSTGLTLMLTSG
jgi:hypothetical protein